MSDNICVAVRVRPFNDREKSRAAKQCLHVDPGVPNSITLQNPANLGAKKVFTFDHVFDSFTEDASRVATQRTVWEAVGKPLLDAAWDGYNSTVFAYGQTGSGKSHSMVGFDHTDLGIVPNACAKLFERIEVAKQSPARGLEEGGRPNSSVASVSFRVECSMLEIYNERVRDLFVGFSRASEAKARGGLKLRDSPQLGVVVEGLKAAAVSSYAQIEALMAQGIKNRTIAATNMNETSSRAHTIFVVRLTQSTTNTSSSSHATIRGGNGNVNGGEGGRDGSGGENGAVNSVKEEEEEEEEEEAAATTATTATVDRTSTINLVDLAGSERQKGSGAAGDRLKEAGAINKSLSALGNVISALAFNAQLAGESAAKRKKRLKAAKKNGRKVEKERRRRGEEGEDGEKEGGGGPNESGGVGVDPLKRHVPYRDSVLTHLLRNSLGGNARTTMLAALSPADVNFEETLSTLRYADRAKQIKNRAVVNTQGGGLQGEVVRGLKQEVLALRRELAEAKQKMVEAKAHTKSNHNRGGNGSGSGGGDDGSGGGSRGAVSALLAAERWSVRQSVEAEMAGEMQKLRNSLEEFESSAKSGGGGGGDLLQSTSDGEGEEGGGGGGSSGAQGWAARQAETDALCLDLVTHQGFEASAFGFEPHLSNLNEDPALSGVLLYPLKRGRNTVVAQSSGAGQVVLGHGRGGGGLEHDGSTAHTDICNSAETVEGHGHVLGGFGVSGVVREDGNGRAEGLGGVVRENGSAELALAGIGISKRHCVLERVQRRNLAGGVDEGKDDDDDGGEEELWVWSLPGAGRTCVNGKPLAVPPPFSSSSPPLAAAAAAAATAAGRGALSAHTGGNDSDGATGRGVSTGVRLFDNDRLVLGANCVLRVRLPMDTQRRLGHGQEEADEGQEPLKFVDWHFAMAELNKDLIDAMNGAGASGGGEGSGEASSSASKEEEEEEEEEEGEERFGGGGGGAAATEHEQQGQQQRLQARQPGTASLSSLEARFAVERGVMERRVEELTCQLSEERQRGEGPVAGVGAVAAGKRILGGGGRVWPEGESDDDCAAAEVAAAAAESASSARLLELERLLAAQIVETKRLTARHDQELRSKTVLDEQLLRMLPLVHEANSISNELGKGLRFAVKLVSKTHDDSAGEGGGGGGGGGFGKAGKRQRRRRRRHRAANSTEKQEQKQLTTEIAVLVHHDLEFDRSPVLWSGEKFQNRVYLMREMYQLWASECSRSVGHALFQSSVFSVPSGDPFFDPPEDALVGVARLQLECSLRWGLDLDEATPLVDYKGQRQGHLAALLLPHLLPPPLLPQPIPPSTGRSGVVAKADEVDEDAEATGGGGAEEAEEDEEEDLAEVARRWVEGGSVPGQLRGLELNVTVRSLEGLPRGVVSAARSLYVAFRLPTQFLHPVLHRNGGDSGSSNPPFRDGDSSSSSSSSGTDPPLPPPSGHGNGGASNAKSKRRERKGKGKGAELWRTPRVALTRSEVEVGHTHSLVLGLTPLLVEEFAATSALSFEVWASMEAPGNWPQSLSFQTTGGAAGDEKRQEEAAQDAESSMSTRRRMRRRGSGSCSDDDERDDDDTFEDDFYDDFDEENDDDKDEEGMNGRGGDSLSEADSDEASDDDDEGIAPHGIALVRHEPPEKERQRLRKWQRQRQGQQGEQQHSSNLEVGDGRSSEKRTDDDDDDDDDDGQLVQAPVARLLALEIEVGVLREDNASLRQQLEHAMLVIAGGGVGGRNDGEEEKEEYSPPTLRLTQVPSNETQTNGEKCGQNMRGEGPSWDGGGATVVAGKSARSRAARAGSDARRTWDSSSSSSSSNKEHMAVSSSEGASVPVRRLEGAQTLDRDLNGGNGDGTAPKTKPERKCYKNDDSNSREI